MIYVEDDLDADDVQMEVERPAYIEQLREALLARNEEIAAHTLLAPLLLAVSTSSEAVSGLVTDLRQLFALLPSTSSSVGISYGPEIAGVPAEDLVLPPGPISDLQELILDAYDVAYLLLADHASNEARTAEQAVLAKKKEADRARLDAEEAIRRTGKSKTSGDQGEVALLRERSSKAAEDLLVARQEQNNTRLDGGTTPHTARLVALTGFLAALQDLLPLPLVKIRVDPPALVTAGLVDAGQSKLDTRAKTQKYYKQQYFNLLREETEGYAKLVVELLSNMGPPHDPATGLPSEPLSICHARAQTVMNNIKSLIGYFDLHPHRALDIVLDVFSDHVIDHHVFFRQLLALSPWAERSQHDEKLRSLRGADELGSRQIASMLGFKFAFYQAPEGPTETPYRLYFMAAILIWDGLVAMSDIYPHLSLSDDALKTAQEKQTQASKGKSKSRMNALAMAGALDGGRLGGPAPAAHASASKAAAAPLDAPSRDLPNQKAGLASALCNIGDLEHAFFILSRFPYLVGSHSNLADDLLRIADHIIEPAYREIPLSWRRTSPDTAFEARQADTGGHRRPRWSAAEKKLVQPTASRPQLSAYAFTRSTAALPFVHFFPEWKDRLPKPATAQAAMEEVFGILRYVGVLSARNLRFFHKLVRIGAETVKMAVNRGDERTKMLWRDVLRQHILPAVSLAEPNTGLAAALWHLLCHYSYQERFSMYGEWNTTTYAASSIMRDRQAEADHEAKNILKRLSSDNTRQSARAMAKIAHSNPCVFFHNAINQIQSYQNMIGPVVESARYLSEMGQDVITFILIENLSRDKDRTKADGTNTADWLLNLADFVGQLFRRYDMRLEPILRYMLAQIQNDNVQDLVIFRSLLSDMTEVKVIDPLTVSDDQVRLLAGSRLMRSHVMTSLVTEAQIAISDRKINTRALHRWQNQVVSSEVCQQLVVRIALCRQLCIDRISEPEASQIQSIASIYDQTHLVLLQLADYLEMHHLDAYEQRVPALWDMLERFGLDLPLAFHLARPMIRKEMAALPAVVAKWEDKAKLQGDLDALRQKVQAARAAAKKDTTSADTPPPPAIAVDPATVLPDTVGDVPKEEEKAGVNPTATTVGGGESPSETTAAGQGDPDNEAVGTPDVITTSDAAIRNGSIEPISAQAPNVNGEADQHESGLDGDQEAMAVDLKEKEDELIKQDEEVPGPDAREPYLDFLKRFMRFEADGGHTPLFYLTFWELKLYDILAPDAGYASLLKSVTSAGPGLKAHLADLEDRSKLPPVGATEQQRAEYKRNLAKEISKIKAAAPRLADRLPRIKADQKEQDGHVARVLARLVREKGQWVIPGKITSFSRFLVGQCVRFRAPLSPVDALYCAELILLLHRIGTPDFSLMWTCEQIFSDNLTALAASFTEQEARNYAFFLSTIFGAIRRWALSTEETYNKEAIGEGEHKLPGLLETGKQPGAVLKHWTHDRFRRCAFKYEDKIRNTLKICLTGPTEHARNALRILIQLIDVFPIHSNIGDELEALARDLTGKDQAIKVLAEGYIAALNKRRPKWAKPFSVTVALATKPPVTPTAKTPEPIDRRDLLTPKPVETDTKTSTANGFNGDVIMQDVKAETFKTPTPLALPPRPAVDPNWREKEAEKRAAGSNGSSSTVPSRPSLQSRQSSETSRSDRLTDLKVGNGRHDSPVTDLPFRESRTGQDEGVHGQSTSAVPADRADERPRAVSRTNEKAGQMNPPPTGPRSIAASPRRTDARAEDFQSPRAPRAERDKAGEPVPDSVRRVSRPGTPDSTHSSSHPSERRSGHRDDTPVEGRSGDRTSRKHSSRHSDRDHEGDGDRDRGSSRRKGDRYSDRHHADRRERDRHHRDSADRDRERRKERERDRERGRDDEPVAKRRRTASPARDDEPSSRRREVPPDERPSSRAADETYSRARETREAGDGLDAPVGKSWDIKGRAQRSSTTRDPVRNMMQRELQDANAGRESRTYGEGSSSRRDRSDGRRR